MEKTEEIEQLEDISDVADLNGLRLQTESYLGQGMIADYNDLASSSNFIKCLNENVGQATSSILIANTIKLSSILICNHIKNFLR